MSFLLAHLLSWSTLLLVIDALLWHLAPFKHLQAVRQQNSRLALLAKPMPIKKGGVFGWLHKR
jgi:hypothetical protein